MEKIERVFKYENVIRGDVCCNGESELEELDLRFYNALKENYVDLNYDPKRYLIDNAIVLALKNEEHLQLEILNFIFDVETYDWEAVHQEKYSIEDLPQYKLDVEDKERMKLEEALIIRLKAINFVYSSSPKRFLIHNALMVLVNDNIYSSASFAALKLLFRLLTNDSKNYVQNNLHSN